MSRKCIRSKNKTEPGETKEMGKIQIRNYKSEDCAAMAELFYHTVHTVNARDYTPQQLDAWASGEVDLAAWDQSFQEHMTVVAEADGKIVGFGDMDDSGYLDRLYVHQDWQGKGVASAICDILEKTAEKDWEDKRSGLAADVGSFRFTTHASITAKPFFIRRGYQVIREQQVERKGVKLTNFVMEKR